MGVIAVAYTVIGGIKAVIHTDTIQWIILMIGLVFIGIPMGYMKLGGWSGIKGFLSPGDISLLNLSFSQIFNWAITIIPIWFVGMTLYQRIYACKDVKTAKKAWFIAGVFEWPIMAFMGVILGFFAKIAFQKGMFTDLGFPPGAEIDAELGLPMFLRNILPIGLMGLMMSAYFSAIMSTADSCLMAASGNFITDIMGSISKKKKKKKNSIKFSQIITLVIGVLAILLATMMQNVLELMLYSYAFMVSGLFVPVLGLLILKKPSSLAALFAMIFGGLTTLVLILSDIDLPFGLDENYFGISLSAIVFIAISIFKKE